MKLHLSATQKFYDEDGKKQYNKINLNSNATTKEELFWECCKQFGKCTGKVYCMFGTGEIGWTFKKNNIHTHIEYDFINN